MSELKRVREPAVAGSFYPADPIRLRRDIEAYIAAVEGPPPAGRPVILIEPHAGYMYSGQVAAYGYKLISGLDIRRVAVISPSHMEHFPFISIYDGDAYETPLGTIQVDVALNAELASLHPDIRLSNRGHDLPGSDRQEHALEVQLPFLQTVLGDFRIVPIVMGDQSWDLCVALGDALAAHLARPDFLVVVSSDLSHFHAYETAREMDHTFCALAENMDAERLYESIRQGESEACGAGGVIAGLLAARKAGASTCRLLHAANSGDVTGDRRRVVGYATAAVFDGGASQAEAAGESETGEALTPAERTYLLDLARAFIELAVIGDAELPPELDSPRLAQPRGAFVTLKIRGRLRGCIGAIEPLKPLRDTVAEMARAAALSDPRFDPLTGHELPDVDIEISALSPLRRIRSAADVIVGTHGILIELGRARGLLLPQVATEHGWDAPTFLAYTCEKAGLDRGAWRDADAKIFVFSADVFGR